MTRTQTGRLTRYGFDPAGDDPRAAAADLLGPDGLGWWDPARQAPVDDRAGALLAALGRAADPDRALRQLHRVDAAARRAGLGPPPLADERLRDRLFAVLGASSALGDHLAAHPDDLAALDGGVVRLDGAAARLGPPTTVAGLRRAYRCALLGIAADDLTGERSVEPTMAALSALADHTLGAAYRIAAGEQGGEPPRLAVIAMGKCGGGELNYVSDVDVVFVADGDADLAAGTRLAVRLMEICGLVAWPVDAALRPEGARGPLVRTLAGYGAYYERWARTWEFQALLKARYAAGDADVAARWQAAVAPLVWCAAERPEAVADVRAMRRRILANVPAGEADREIKRGPGGLRDIEFAVQLLQLVHGRADASLRVPGTMPALRALVAGGYVARTDGEALLAGYGFLRRVEHRLQLQALRRTHTVPDADTPDGAAALRRLAHALGYRAGPARSAAGAFHADWRAHAAEVRRLHAKLLYRPLLEAVARVPAAELRLTPAAAGRRLELLGFADPAGALRHIEALTGGLSRRAAIQRTLLPVLLGEFADAPEPDRGLLAYRQVSDALGATAWYLRLLRDGGPIAQRLARLLGLARYAVDLLTRDPEALRLLADDAELRPRPAAALAESMLAAAGRHLDGAAGDPVAAVRAVRALRRRELFRVAGADVLAHAGPLAPAEPLTADAVAAALTDIADATLAAALAVARRAAGAPPGLRLAVIGMGRLGGRELSYPSDADVLFVYEAAPDVPDPAATAHAVAQHLRDLLAMPAPDPPLGVDADLRPEGRQGPLVRSLDAYAAYYARWSRVWEAQALLRARPVAGDAGLGERFIALADGIRYPDGGLSPEQLVEIRRIKARVETERLPRGADPATHTKLGRGGLADVEWAVQILQLRHGARHAGLRTTGTVAALAAARAAGLLAPADAAALTTAWQRATAVRSALTLVRGKATDQLPRHGVDLAGVVALFGADDPGELLDGYLRTARHARAAVERIING
ncbi:glutamate-ammonia-ligase adenylyltransferase [Pilimelia anulata]|uniref:Glutamate-ammonia-ligase adenylyltransferase n=1 Tax=Pilimelia anulata TaxID=53371 RepID=A0A8J3F703_9ACTN|nr:bifunctional [glutamine synthetase] adenylyltransferase/[glutamine synthetase]-adenylyl-L-tyrosine phosphorylase [Pilimelia anulata]GGJ84611.1 glutamate-ammonia-ligase adenylyltransferase [Pilimelia anulata]